MSAMPRLRLPLRTTSTAQSKSNQLPALRLSPYLKITVDKHNRVIEVTTVACLDIIPTQIIRFVLERGRGGGKKEH